MIKSAIYALLTIVAVIGFVLGLTFFEWFRILTLVSVLGGLLFATWLFLFDEFEQKRRSKQVEYKIDFSAKAYDLEARAKEIGMKIAELEKRLDKR